MTDQELSRLLGEVAEQPIPRPPPVDEARIVDAMVKATRPRSRRLRWIAASMAAAAALVVGGGLTARWLTPARAPRVAHVLEQSGEVMVVAAQGSSEAVEAGGRSVHAGDRVVTLGDGQAVVSMAGATAAVGPRGELVVGAPSEAVTMRGGAARFDVSKRDAASPFRVRASDVDITVYGTSFSVAVDGPSVKVTVHEGIVGVHPRGGPEVRLTAGQTWPAAEPEREAKTPEPARDGDGRTTDPRAADGREPSEAPRASAAAPSPPVRGTDTDVAPSGARGARAAASGTDARRDADPSHLADQNELLARAADARRRGDTSAEARLLDAFVKRHANSPGLHDALAAKMRAASRSGDQDAAAREARAYLARFPDGPLRDEALATIARATRR